MENMKNHWLLLSFFLLSIAIISCEESGTSGDIIDPNEKKTENGFRFIHHIDLEGAQPQAGEFAYFHYDLRIDDSLLDGSRTRGFIPKMEIPQPKNEDKNNPSPVLEAVKEMSVGDSITLIYPMDSLPQKPAQFPDAKYMYYDISLKQIKTKAQFKEEERIEREQKEEQARQKQIQESEIGARMVKTADDYKNGKLDKQIKTTELGLKYIIHKQGTGKFPTPGEKINVDYYGVLSNGVMFDNSYKRGKPYQFGFETGSVIPGWDKGLALLKKGGKMTIFIPPGLAYGKTGSPPVIPPNSELIFYMELRK